MSVETPRREFAYDNRRRAGGGEPPARLRHAGGGPQSVCRLSFPVARIGHVGKRGDSFHYFAAPMRMVLYGV